MRLVIVASQNPVKIAVAKEAFGKVYEGEEFVYKDVDVASGVPDQPRGIATLLGAKGRLAAAHKAYPDADFWISQEGGLYTEPMAGTYNRAWTIVRDKDGHEGKASTGSFEIPTAVLQLVSGGLELAAAFDRVFDTESGGRKKGGIHRLSNGIIDRKRFYRDAAIIAITMCANYELYIPQFAERTAEGEH